MPSPQSSETKSSSEHLEPSDRLYPKLSQEQFHQWAKELQPLIQNPPLPANQGEDLPQQQPPLEPLPK